MREYIEYSDLIESESFVIWYLMHSFPAGVTKDDDALVEIMDENYGEAIDVRVIDELTGYYQWVSAENDGYIDNPKTLTLALSSGDKLFIELHPGDTLYFLNDELLGSTGPEYKIQRITLDGFFGYTNGMNDFEKMLILPMIKIRKDESEDFLEIVASVLKSAGIDESDTVDICDCIVSNCLAE